MNTISLSQKDIKFHPWDWVTFSESQIINSITEGNEYIYFATNGGILRYNFFGNYWDYPISTSQGLNSNFVNSIYYDLNTNILWASTKNTLHYSNNKGESWNQINNVNFDNIKRIGGDKEYLYCVNNSFIIKINNFSGDIIEYITKINQNDNIRWSSPIILDIDIIKNKINNFAFLDGWYFNANNYIVGPKLSDKHKITTFFSDSFGDIWIGTNKGYVFKGSNQLLILELVYKGLTISNISDLKIWKNKLWISGNNQYNLESSINLFNYNDFKSEIFTSKNEINFNFNLIYKIKKILNEWYFLSFDGIQIFEPNKENWFFLNKSQKYFDYNYENSISNDDQYIYLGNKNGINRFDINSFEFNYWPVSQKIGNNPIEEIYWDGRNLWICSKMRIWRWVKEADFLTEYSSYNNNITTDFFILESPVESITSSNDKIFFAEKTNLLIIDKTNFTWKRVKYNRKLISAKVFEIEYFKNNQKEEIIWFATNKGVFLINLSKKYQLDFEEKNGLSSNFVSSIEIINNEIWFGTSSGLCRFNWINYLK